MADEQDRHSKTEEPTARRLEKAREDGQVARSTELTSSVVILCGVFIGMQRAPATVDGLRRVMSEALTSISARDLTPGQVLDTARNRGAAILEVAGPMSVAVALAAAAIASGEAAADLTSPAIHKGKARSRAEPGDAVGLELPQRTASAGNEPHAMATAAPSRTAAVRASAPLAWLATASAATQNTIATTQAARRRAAARRSSVAVLHRAGMEP